MLVPWCLGAVRILVLENRRIGIALNSSGNRNLGHDFRAGGRSRSGKKNEMGQSGSLFPDLVE